MKILTNDYRTNLPGESHVAPGGPANFARAFSAYAIRHGHSWIGLVQRGHDKKVTRITKTASVGKKTYYDCLLPESRYLPFLKLEKTPDPREWYAEEIRAARAFIRRIRPDVLFLNGFSVYAWLLLEAARQECLPIIIQHAGIARVEFEQYKHLYSRAGRKAMFGMERDIVAAARTQVFLNEYSRDTFARLLSPSPEGQAMIIPLPFLVSGGTAAVLRADSKPRPAGMPVVIGCVARWDRIKNHRALLHMAREAKRLGLRWTFRSVTRIPDTKVQARFKAAYRREIEVVPPMGRRELAGFYRSVDALVLPSHFDVSPTVVMEAAMLGKPTLISEGVGWNTEYREAGMGEWIADFSDAPGAVRKLRRLLTKKPSHRFRNMIRTKHAPEKAFASYLRAFERARRLCA